MIHIQQLLANLANAREDLTATAAPFDAAIDEIVSARDNETRLIQEKVHAIEKVIREEVLKHGETVKGTRIWAVYNHGRVSWDTQALMGYGVAHPEIKTFRKQGNPYVSLRKAKGAK